MKPSERVKVIHDFLSRKRNTDILEAHTIKAILYVLDEEAAKPRYACPNCHRVVDELVGKDDGNGYMLLDAAGTPLDPHCKYCLNSIKGENDGNV